jgi:hypothetical protein
MFGEMLCVSIIRKEDEIGAENVVQNKCNKIYFMPISIMAHSLAQIHLLIGTHYAK